MADTKTPPKEDKPKGLIGKLKEAAEDKEEQMMILSTFVRLGILVWSGAILTLAYVELPPALKIPKQDLDPTFIASVFTGVLATFGVQAGRVRVMVDLVVVQIYLKKKWRSLLKRHLKQPLHR